MSIVRRFIPLISSLVMAGMLEWLIYQPLLVWGVVAVVCCSGVAASVMVSRSEVRGGRWHFAVLALLYCISVLVFLLLLHQPLLKHVQIISAAIVWWLWLEQLYRFHYQPNQYVPFSVANVTSLVTVLTSFFLISAAFAFKLFLGYPIWAMTVITAGAGFLFTIEMIWSEKLSPWRYWIMPITIALLTAELFWTLSYLPSSYLVNGFLLTVMLYVIVNLGRFRMKQELQPVIVRRYLLISALVVLLVVATARWV